MLMKKRLLFFSATCLAMVASCTDDTETVAPSGTAVSDVKMSDKLTRGVNVFISDNIGCDTIYLDTKQDVTLSYNEESGIVFQQVRDEQGYTCLIPDVREANKSAVDEVLITTPDNRSKSVTVILRHSTPSATRATAIVNRGIDALARGIPACSVDGVTDLFMFDRNMLAQDNLVEDNTLGRTTEVKEYHETSLEKFTKKFSLDFGINASYPIKSVLVGLKVNYNYNESSAHEREREYYMKVTKAIMGRFKLNKGAAEDKHEDLGMIYYMNNVLNNILNNNKDNNEYKRDKDGIYRLLDDYGIMYADRVLLGGTASMIFSRDMNMHQNSISWDLKVALSAKKFVQSQAANAQQDHWEGGDNGHDVHLSEAAFESLLKALTLKDNAEAKDAENKKLELSFGIGCSEDEYTKVTKAKLDVSLRGGNIGSSKTYEGWIPSEDPNKWIVVARDDQGQTTNTRFYDILSLVKKGIPVDVDDSVPDAECSYAQLIKRYYDQYIEDHTPKDNTSKAPFIIADFLMLSPGSANANIKDYLSSNGGDSHTGAFPKPFIMTSPDGVDRIYYPIMMNNQDTNISEDNFFPGYALDTGNDSFLVKHHTKSHLWYYAIDRADQCPGIADIKVDFDCPGNGYIQRGSNSDDGIVGCYRTVYVWAKFGDEKDRNKYEIKKSKSASKYNGKEREGEYLNKITGVGLKCNDHNKIIGATAGSDIPFPFTPSAQNRFDMIWKYPLKNAYAKVGERFYDSFWTRVPHDLYVVFTKEVLEDKYFHGIDINNSNDNDLSGLNIDRKNPSIPKMWNE